MNKERRIEGIVRKRFPILVVDISIIYQNNSRNEMHPLFVCAYYYVVLDFQWLTRSFERFPADNQFSTTCNVVNGDGDRKNLSKK